MKELDKLFTDGQMNVVTSCNLCRVISFNFFHFILTVVVAMATLNVLCQ